MYMKLKEYSRFEVEYYGDHSDYKTYKGYEKDTVFLGRVMADDTFSVYLDEDGDGMLYIPLKQLEKIKEKDVINWNIVVGD